ncbi:MAG: phosphoribosylanthranilate isomerase, partial [Pseudomonadales bacterium]
GLYGGTGQSFDWGQVPNFDQPLILAGGLTAENVGQAIASVQPFSVDVSGGVESAPGIKDERKIAAFVSAVKQADQAR